MEKTKTKIKPRGYWQDFENVRRELEEGAKRGKNE